MAVSVDAAVDGAVLSKKWVDRVDRDSKDVIVESVFDAEEVNTTIVIFV